MSFYDRNSLSGIKLGSGRLITCLSHKIVTLILHMLDNVIMGQRECMVWMCCGWSWMKGSVLKLIEICFPFMLLYVLI